MPDVDEAGEVFWESEDDMFSLSMCDSTDLGRQDICDALREYFGPPGYENYKRKSAFD